MTIPHALAFVAFIVFAALFLFAWGRTPSSSTAKTAGSSRASDARLEPCPACGSTKVHVVPVGTGFRAAHICPVPSHSQCRVKLPVESEDEARRIWNYRVEQWIKERDITEPL